MIINHNIPALAGINVLNRVNKERAKNNDRLTSGYKLTNAGDDPSGYIVSRRINAQIKGLDAASRNCNDAISLIQTTDGSLSEISNMIQRMRELAIEGANGTFTEEDRRKIQQEIDELVDEVHQIAERTQFNTKNLFDGSNPVFTIHTGANANVDFDIYMTTSNSLNLGCTSEDYFSFDYTLSLNDEEVTQTAKIRSIASLSSNYSKYYTDELADTYEQLVSARTNLDNAVSSYNIILAEHNYETDNRYVLDANKKVINSQLILSDIEKAFNMMSKEASYGTYKGISSDTSSAQSALNSAETNLSDALDDLAEKERNYALNPTNAALKNQVDAARNTVQSAYDNLRTAQSAYFDTVEEGCGAYLTREGCEAVIGVCVDAVATIASFRAKLGASESRLEYTIESIAESSITIAGAFSNLADTDVAEEMIEYTKNSILDQAGISMIAQANHRPDQLIALLQ